MVYFRVILQFWGHVILCFTVPDDLPTYISRFRNVSDPEGVASVWKRFLLASLKGTWQSAVVLVCYHSNQVIKLTAFDFIQSCIDRYVISTHVSYLKTVYLWSIVFNRTFDGLSPSAVNHRVNMTVSLEISQLVIFSCVLFKFCFRGFLF